MGADEGAAERPALCVDDCFDQPVGAAFGLGTVVFGKMPAQDLIVSSPQFLFRLGLGQANLGDFGVGIGDPGDRSVVHFGPEHLKQHLADDDARVIACHMGKLQPARHVANGKDAAVAGFQMGIDGNGPALRLNACLVQVQTGGIGAAAHSDQKMAAGNHVLLAILFHRGGNAGIGGGDAFQRSLLADIQTFGA